MNKLYLIAGAVVVIVAGFFIVKSPVLAPTPSPVACTEEAKLCPDGSYVGRTGPNCEFSECPTPQKEDNTIPPVGQKQGTVRGVVTLSPTCPGPEKNPPDSNCSPKGYSTSIDIMKSGTTKIIKTILSDANGAFSASLDAGAYILKARGGSVLPRCGEVTAEVKSGQNTNTDIYCDSGLR